jgi:poly [ADP-ribose] polymerase
MGDGVTIELAKTGRARCRTCRQAIDKGTLRFGEEQPSAFSEGTQWVWHHLACAAKKKPQLVRDALAKFDGDVPGRDEIDKLLAEADKKATTFPYAERAPTGRSKCQHCDASIEKGTLRIAVERDVEVGGMMRQGAGYLHPKCAVEHTGDEHLMDLVRANSKALSPAELDELAEQLDA